MGTDIAIVIEQENAGEWECFAQFAYFPRYPKLFTMIRLDARGWPPDTDEDTKKFFEKECSELDKGAMTCAGMANLALHSAGPLPVEFRAIVAFCHVLQDAGENVRMLYAFDQ